MRETIRSIHAIDAGILFMLASALISAMNGAVAKMLGDEMSAMEIVFFRNLIGMFIILATLRHTPATLPGGKLLLLLLRGFFGFAAMILFFYTITTIPLAEAITLNKTSPLFVAILAFFLMGERLNRYALLALFIGFLGVAFITKPLGLAIGYEHFLGLLGGFFAACAYATIKTIRRIYDARVIVLSFVGMGTFVPLLLFLLAPHVEVPDPLAFLFPHFSFPVSLHTWTLIAFMALVSTLSQWLLTKAYSLGRAGIVGVVSYTNIPFAVGFGWMLGDPFPDIWVWTGIGLIILAGTLLKKS
ncbi:DMT family transporter [Hydrogenimonas urashimensis]|uniref:DMT family transporter n=1 Tax=Hydrogenimonas urashimensis TaxID=2740515 RepID=UPI001F192D74|nr:DMT family transporter [Hydrogenimonas urashimensis]